MHCVSCDICVCHHWFVCAFSLAGVFLSSSVTRACPVTTDLILRVNVRTTTNTTSVVPAPALGWRASLITFVPICWLAVVLWIRILFVRAGFPLSF